MCAIKHQTRNSRATERPLACPQSATRLRMRPECALTGAEFKRLCDALRESEQRMQVMADALPVLISYVDCHQRYRFNNAEYQKWFGTPHRSFIGRTVRSVLGTVIKALREVLAGRVFVSPKMSEHFLLALSGRSKKRGGAIDVLTDRELDVLQLVGRGLNTRQVAQQLRLSPKTVGVHKTRIKEKLGCPNWTANHSICRRVVGIFAAIGNLRKEAASARRGCLTFDAMDLQLNPTE